MRLADHQSEAISDSSGRKPNSPGIQAIFPAPFCTSLETAFVFHLISIFLGVDHVAGILSTGSRSNLDSALSMSSGFAPAIIHGGFIPPLSSAVAPTFSTPSWHLLHSMIPPDVGAP